MSLPRVFLAYAFDFGWVETTVRDCARHQATVEVAKDKLTGKHLLEKIQRMMADSDLCLFDLTGHNPNVSLELGVAHALKYEYRILYCTDEKYNPKPGRTSDLFSDMRGWDSLLYADEQDLRERLSGMLPTVLGDLKMRTNGVIGDLSIRPFLQMKLSTQDNQQTNTRWVTGQIVNRGKGAAIKIRCRMLGINQIVTHPSLAPGDEPWMIQIRLDQSDAFKIQPQFPVAVVEYQDEDGSKYRQIGRFNPHGPDASGRMSYQLPGLEAAEPLAEYTMRYHPLE